MQQSVLSARARCRFVASRARTVYMSLLDVDRENLALLAAFSLSTSTNTHATYQHLSLPSPPPPPFSLSPFEWARDLPNLSETLPQTPQRRYPRKAQHGYNCNLHQVYRRISAVRRARKVSDRTAAFVWRVTLTLSSLTALCLIVLPVSSSVCWQQPSNTEAYRFSMSNASASR